MDRPPPSPDHEPDRSGSGAPSSPPLPEALEDQAYEILLGDAAGRERAFAELLAAHPEARAGLLRLQRSLRSAESALCDTGLAEAPPPPRLGNYTLRQKLGEGGFGVVWLAEQAQPIARQVALKLIRPGMDSAAVLARFQAEREVLARFDHPCIAKVLDAGQTAEGQPFLVTEFVAGLPLAQYCRERRLGLRARLELLLQVCDGVQHAHQRGVIHRDLKPSNVLVGEVDGVPRAKVIDFGLARAFGAVPRLELTRAGALVGTPEYMSPEQAEGQADLDIRTDVYALGVMLYELLVDDLPLGRDRWRRAGLSELSELIRRAEPPPPSSCVRVPALARAVRGDLDWIVLTAMHKDRSRRYSNVAQFAADLRAFLQHRPVSVGPPSLGYQLRRFVRRHRAPVVFAAAAVLALVAGLVVSVRALARAEAADAEARAHLGRYFGLADVVQLRELRREAAAAWPASPDRVPAYVDWLARAEALLARGEARRQIVESAGAGGEADRFLRETLRELGQELEVFAGEGGELADVRRRWAFAREVERRTRDEAADRWQRAAAAVQADARFGGLRLTPQLGLLPLGADPDSGLEEFAVLQTGAAPRRDAQGRLQLAGDSALVLVLLPGGRCAIGAQDEDPAAPRYEHQPQIGLGGVQEVELAPFFLGKHELTRGQWLRVFGRDPSHYPIGGVTPDGPLTVMHPVENLSWEEAELAMRRLALTLPTEAQWEYGCRAGTVGRWFTGDDPASLQGACNLGGREAAWMQPQGITQSLELDDGVQFMAPIGRFQPNRFGLHDCVGNYMEWCLDGPFRIDVPVRPGDGHRGAPVPAEREHLLRGGSYADPAMRATSSYRAVGFGRNRNSLASVRAARALAP